MHSEIIVQSIEKVDVVPSLECPITIIEYAFIVKDMAKIRVSHLSSHYVCSEDVFLHDVKKNIHSCRRNVRRYTWRFAHGAIAIAYA
jgi:hypothetical protein